MSNEITWRLENENIGRLLVHYAIPAVIGTMVNALYNIVDRIFIGQGVGALAISGLTLTFPILLFMQAFGMLIGAVLNVILDPIFIFWLDMGIQGAAIATVISMAAGAAFVMSHFISKDSIVRFHTKYFRLKGPIIWNIFTIGMSPFSMQLAGSVVVVIMNHALKENGGDLAIGASGIISSIAMLLVMLIIGIAQGMQPIVGFNHGAGHHDRVLATLRLSIIVSTLITGVGCIVSLLFPRLIVSVFSTDAELVSITDNGLRLTMLVFFVVGSQITISQFFQSIGVAWKAMFLSLSRQVLFLIPAILLFPPIWGLDGVWLAQPFSDFIAAVTAWGFLWYHS